MMISFLLYVSVIIIMFILNFLMHLNAHFQCLKGFLLFATNEMLDDQDLKNEIFNEQFLE